MTTKNSDPKPKSSDPEIENPAANANGEGSFVKDPEAENAYERIGTRGIRKNYDKTYLVSVYGKEAYKPLQVAGCCDESEAVRVYRQHYRITNSKVNFKARLVS